MSIPQIIGVCGHPTSGNTTAAEIINEVYGHEIADDGRPLRMVRGSTTILPTLAHDFS